MPENLLLSIIRNNILFLDIEDSVLNKIVPLLDFKEFTENTTIYSKGDISNGLYLVIKGDIEIFAERDDKKYFLSQPSISYLFGEFLLQGKSERSTSAKTLSQAQLLFFSRANFNLFFDSFPEQGSIIAARILKRLHWNQATLALRLSHLFVDLPEEVVRTMLSQMEIQSIPSNTLLTTQGAISKELWVIIDGQFQLSKKTPEGNTIKLAVLGRGEAIGEVGVSCEIPRSSDVLATRDSTVAKLSRESFESLLKKYPVEIYQTFVKSIVSHLSKKYSNKVKPAETFVLIFLSTDLDQKNITQQLVAALKNHGSTHALHSQDIDRAFSHKGLAQTAFTDPVNEALLQWLSEQEIAHRHIIYIVDNEMSNWTKRCLRHADHLVFCANALDDPNTRKLETLILHEISTKPIKKTLLLIHPNTTKIANNTNSWLTNRSITLHHHIRKDSLADFDRVARFLTGNAIGVVLGGGAARGFAHIGVLRAFAELNIPIDMIGGNSMGAIIAAQYAMQWDYQDMIDKTQYLCRKGDKLTLPISSIFSGKNMVKGLISMFGESHIEDLWLHFFSISCNISKATVMTHDKGALVSALLNSNSPPGLFPPQIVNGDLLVDGALLNNVPIDVMAQFNEGGTIIAVDVNAREDLLNNTNNTGSMSGWHLFINKINPWAEKIKNPGIIEILARAGIIGGLAQRKKLINGVADLYMQPPVNGFPLLVYKNAEKIEKVGYLYAKRALQEWQQTRS